MLSISVIIVLGIVAIGAFPAILAAGCAPDPE
jgi:hypothetical protein